MPKPRPESSLAREGSRNLRLNMAPGGAHGGRLLIDCFPVAFLPQSERVPVRELYGLLVSRF